ncbi:hypothetical protein O6H91_23G007400 [Diphasiastrum complanatum]|uniref:Uncharacterized protein n=1 Tax=Diphasiastrum complanatum TaxID=34168 RepID=A0ACC2A7S9_DIPCM|nr:hypothetical protein O6H91_23G007400 [Diphasiastrum complanatum]
MVAYRRTQQHHVPFAFACLVVALLPLLSPRFFSPTPWETSLFSEWEPPKIRHSQLLNSLEHNHVDKPGDVWSPLEIGAWKPCTEVDRSQSLPPENTVGYLQVFLEGGLNQQRMGICDAVAVAKIMNATLLLPYFGVNRVWQDTSSFEEIFDVDYFINALKGIVKVVTELPEEYSWSTREYYGTGIRVTRIKDAPVHASPSWYLSSVLPILQSYGIVAIAPFSHRLGFENIPLEIQRLRCMVNFHALHFVPAIKYVGDAIIQRLRQSEPEQIFNSSFERHQEKLHASYNSKFLALHLRFDKDMAAHSGCDFGGGKVELLAMSKYRRVVWAGRGINSHLSMEKLRELGKCPLTPEEVGLTLAALGYNNRTKIYLASFTVYGGEARMSIFHHLFPFVTNKTRIAREDELQPFNGKASMLAAIDYYVCLHSDVFLSASPGNMHNALLGHRAFENRGNTIRPDMVLLSRLFANESMQWPEFKSRVLQGHQNRRGQVRLRQSKQSIYTYPAPDCMCKSES